MPCVPRKRFLCSKFPDVHVAIYLFNFCPRKHKILSSFDILWRLMTHFDFKNNTVHYNSISTIPNAPKICEIEHNIIFGYLDFHTCICKWRKVQYKVKVCETKKISSRMQGYEKRAHIFFLLRIKKNWFSYKSHKSKYIISCYKASDDDDDDMNACIIVIMIIMHAYLL